MELKGNAPDDWGLYESGWRSLSVLLDDPLPNLCGVSRQQDLPLLVVETPLGSDLVPVAIDDGLELRVLEELDEEIPDLPLRHGDPPVALRGEDTAKRLESIRSFGVSSEPEMRVSERDLRVLLGSAAEIAAVDDPERFQAAVLAVLLAIAQAESELLDLRAQQCLTKRERELLNRATRGETNHEIAEALVISPRTVAKHLEHAYEKLGVHGRREAARFIRETLAPAHLLHDGSVR